MISNDFMIDATSSITYVGLYHPPWALAHIKFSPWMLGDDFHYLTIPGGNTMKYSTHRMQLPWQCWRSTSDASSGAMLLHHNHSLCLLEQCWQTKEGYTIKQHTKRYSTIQGGCITPLYPDSWYQQLLNWTHNLRCILSRKLHDEISTHHSLNVHLNKSVISNMVVKLFNYKWIKTAVDIHEMLTMVNVTNCSWVKSINANGKQDKCYDCICTRR